MSNMVESVTGVVHASTSRDGFATLAAQPLCGTVTVGVQIGHMDVSPTCGACRALIGFAESQAIVEREIRHGRAEAAGMTAVDLRSCASLTVLNDRILHYQLELAWAVDENEPYTAGSAAFDLQRNLDMVHARAAGQCPGCARDFNSDWTHQPDCAAATAQS